MSRYEEIVTAYSRARKEFFDNKIACSDFARELVAGMVEYFDWPQDREITYIPLDEELDPNNKFYALAGAMRLDEHAFWYFGLALNLAEISGINPLSMVFSFYIKQDDANFKVRLGQGGQVYTIPSDKRGDDLGPFYDRVFKEIELFLQKHLGYMLADQPVDNTFISILQDA